jgi:hypothetical protein
MVFLLESEEANLPLHIPMHDEREGRALLRDSFPRNPKPNPKWGTGFGTEGEGTTASKSTPFLLFSVFIFINFSVP